jgi:hypothetical protein
MTEAEVLAALAERHQRPEWAFVRHVPNGTGARATRTADAVAMNLYPSRGLELHGFEVKVSASDLRRELKDPDKAEQVACYCDRWWLVTTKDVAKSGAAHDVPGPWGIMLARPGSVRVLKQASKLDAKQIDRAFVAGLLRAETRADDAEVEARVRQRVSAEVERRVASELAVMASSAPRALRAVEAFKAASGIDLLEREWTIGDVGAAVRYLTERGVDQVRRDLHRTMETLDEVRKSAAEALGKLPTDTPMGPE